MTKNVVKILETCRNQHVFTQYLKTLLSLFLVLLQIWGGESIELAIKLWLCGGQIEIVPCSRIGHIFRRFHAFEFPPEPDLTELNSPERSSAQSTYLQ